MIKLGTYIKDPDAVLDYGQDWGTGAVVNGVKADWLEEDEVISTSTWFVPTGLTKNSDTHDDKTTGIWLAGGTVGTDYPVTNRVTTSGGRTDDRTITISVRQR